MPRVAETIAPVDVEALVIDALTAAYAGRGETAKVSTRVPSTRPPRMTRISLVNTFRQTPTHFGCSILVECWAPTEKAASALARTTYALLFALDGEDVDGRHVVGVTEVGGVVSFQDETGAPRYQFTVELLIRGELI